MKYLLICLVGCMYFFSPKAEAACKSEIRVEDFTDTVNGTILCGYNLDPKFRVNNPNFPDISGLHFGCSIEGDRAVIAITYHRYDMSPVVFTGDYELRVDRGEVYNGRLVYVDGYNTPGSLIITKKAPDPSGNVSVLGLDLSVLLPQFIAGDVLRIRAKSNFGYVTGAMPLSGFTKALRKVCPVTYKQLR